MLCRKVVCEPKNVDSTHMSGYYMTIAILCTCAAELAYKVSKLLVHRVGQSIIPTFARLWRCHFSTTGKESDVATTEKHASMTLK